MEYEWNEEQQGVLAKMKMRCLEKLRKNRSQEGVKSSSRIKKKAKFLSAFRERIEKWI